MFDGFRPSISSLVRTSSSASLSATSLIFYLFLAVHHLISPPISCSQWALRVVPSSPCPLLMCLFVFPCVQLRLSQFFLDLFPASCLSYILFTWWILLLFISRLLYCLFILCLPWSPAFGSSLYILWPWCWRLILEHNNHFSIDLI